MTEAAQWYEVRQAGLGAALVEVIRVWDELATNPRLNSRRSHSANDVRWRLTPRFPFRVVYEVQDATRTVVIACVGQAVRHDREWQCRV